MDKLDLTAAWQTIYEMQMADLASIASGATTFEPDADTLALMREEASWSKAQMLGGIEA